MTMDTTDVPTEPGGQWVGSTASPAPDVSRVKTKRRPILAVVMAALVAAGALLAAFAYMSLSDTQDVLAMRDTIYRGEVIEEEDLVVVRVGVDPALEPVSAGERRALVGRRAAVDLAAGTLLTREAVAETTLPSRGNSIVGISLTAAQMPSEQLYNGDAVRVVVTPGDQGEVIGSPETLGATVMGVRRILETGETVVDVTVPSEEAGQLAAQAATGRVALILDSRER